MKRKFCSCRLLCLSLLSKTCSGCFMIWASVKRIQKTILTLKIHAHQRRNLFIWVLDTRRVFGDIFKATKAGQADWICYVSMAEPTVFDLMLEKYTTDLCCRGSRWVSEALSLALRLKRVKWWWRKNKNQESRWRLAKQQNAICCRKWTLCRCIVLLKAMGPKSWWNPQTMEMMMDYYMQGAR